MNIFYPMVLILHHGPYRTIKAVYEKALKVNAAVLYLLFLFFFVFFFFWGYFYFLVSLKYFSSLNILVDFKTLIKIISKLLITYTNVQKLDMIKLITAASDFAYILFPYCSSLLSLTCWFQYFLYHSEGSTDLYFTYDLSW